jgi:hypothetical protein
MINARKRLIVSTIKSVIKKLNHQSFNVSVLDYEDLKTRNGGDFGIGAAILVGCAIATFAEVIGEWDNFERGFTGKPCKE